MCGIYSQRYACLSYEVHMSACRVIFTCITLTFTYNLVGGKLKAYFIIVQQNFAHNLVSIGILGFIILLQCGGINPQHIYSVHVVQHGDFKNQFFDILCLSSWGYFTNDQPLLLSFMLS